MSRSPRDESRLQQLQDVLVHLKSENPQLKLSKTPSSKSANAPFPITMSVSIAAPLSASRYDVDHLDLRITVIDKIIFHQVPADAVEVAITNEDLPRKLCLAISQRLHSIWAAAVVGAASSGRECTRFGLQLLLQNAEDGFLQLITLLPQLLEAYQSTDASGATQRRYAIVVDDDTTITEVKVGNAVVVNATDSTEAVVASSSVCSDDAAAASSENARMDASRAQHGPSTGTADGCTDNSSSSSTASRTIQPVSNGRSGMALQQNAAATDNRLRATALSATAAAWNPSQQQQQQQSPGSVVALGQLPAVAPHSAASGSPACAVAGSSSRSPGSRGGGRLRGHGWGGGRHIGTAGGRPQQQDWQQKWQQQQYQPRRDAGRAPDTSGASHQQATGAAAAGSCHLSSRQDGRGRGRGRGREQRPAASRSFANGQQWQEPPAGAAADVDADAAATAALSGMSLTAAAAETGASQGDAGGGGRQVQSRYPGTTFEQKQQQHMPGDHAGGPQAATVLKDSAALAQTSGPLPAAAAAAAGRGGGRGRGRAGRGPVGPGRGHLQQQQQLPGRVLAQQDLAAVQRKYGNAFRFQQPLEQQWQHQKMADSSTAGSAAPVGDLRSSSQDVLQAQHFSLMLRPTDPQWGVTRGALLIMGTFNPTAYPGPSGATTAATAANTDSILLPSLATTSANGSEQPSAGSGSSSSPVTLNINPSRGVTAAEVYVLQSALDQQLQQEVGRPWQLRSVLKWLENYAGSRIEEYFKAQEEFFGKHTASQEQLQQQQHDSSSGYLGPQSQQQGRYDGQAGCGRHQQPQRRQPKPARRQTEVVMRLRTTHVQQQQPVKAVAAAAVPPTGSGIKLLRKAQAAAALEEQEQSRSKRSGDSAAIAPAPGATAAVAAQSGPEDFAGYRRLHHKESLDVVLQTAAGTHANIPGAHCTGSSSGSSSIDGSDYTSADQPSSEDGGSHSDGLSCPHSEYSTDGEAASTSDSEGEHEVQLHGGTGAEVGSSPGGYALTLEGLKLDNIGVLEAVQAQLQLVCRRCDGRLTVVLTAEGGQLTSSLPAIVSNATAAVGGADGRAAAAATGPSKSSSSSSSSRAFEWDGSCRVCSAQLSVLLRPRFVHEGNNILAGLKCSGCTPLDLLPGVYGATCADCDAVGALRGLQLGAAANRTCSHCHRPMSCLIPSVSFIPRGSQLPSSSRTRRPDSSAVGQQQAQGRAGGVLVEGSPLPNNGACKHYRHSYRWLRFPCCGQRFACDLCHEEAVPDGHDAAWASRMVCGFCSREQPLEKVCKHCGKKLATSAAQPSGRNTRFWEGGKGCRDVKMLDRRDAHKYRNSKHKTKSAKAKRVGPKPWSGSAEAAASGTCSN